MTTANIRAVGVETFGGAERLVELTLPAPEAGPGQVLVRVRATAVNPADVGMVAGRYPWAGPARLPLVPGYDVAGTVEAVGDGVTDLRPGQDVIAHTSHWRTQTGAYAELVAVDRRGVAPAPQGLDPTHAATLPLAGMSALAALDALDLRPGGTLLVNGPLGAIGGFAAQLAAGRGLTVLGTVRAGDEDEARALGVAEPLDRDGDPAAEARKIVDGGVDAALDVVGGAAARTAFEAVRDGGRYATLVPEVWIPGGPFTPERGIAPHVATYDPVGRARPDEVDQTAPDARLELLSTLAATGKLTTRVGGTFPLAQARAAHELMAARPPRGKLVLLAEL